MKKILVIRFSSIGDVVLTSPVIRCIKNQIEGAEIHYLTKQIFIPLLENNPFLSKTFGFDDNFNSLIKELKIEKYDFVIDLHKNIRSKRFISALKVTSASVNKMNLSKWMMVNANKKAQIPSIVDRYLDTVNELKVINDNQGLDFFLTEIEKNTSLKLPLDFQKEYIAFAIGATYDGKKMSASKSREIITNLTVPVLLLGDKTDLEKGDFIADKLTNIYNACGEFSIRESAGLLYNSALVIAHDSGLMHIATALQKPLITIWGCTTPSLGMAPYLPNNLSVIIEPLGRDKRPCSKLGNRCKYSENCIEKVENSSIISSINELINQLK